MANLASRKPVEEIPEETSGEAPSVEGVITCPHCGKEIEMAKHGHMTFRDKVRAIAANPDMHPREKGQTKVEAAERIAGAMVRDEKKPSFKDRLRAMKGE